MASWPQRKLPMKIALNTKAILRTKKLKGKTRIHLLGLSSLTLVASKIAPYLVYILVSLSLVKFLHEQHRKVMMNAAVKDKKIKETMFE